MGRSKYRAPLDKAERKRVKNGASVADNINQRTFRAFRGCGAFNNNDIADTRASTRSHSQTSNNWVHAVIFVVLVVIVISWALGY